MIKIFKTITLTMVIFLMSCNSTSDMKTEGTNNESINTMKISIEDNLDSDEYGMRSYVIGFLKDGSKPITNQEKYKILLTEHLKGLRRLINNGKLLFQGPVLDGKETKEIRGVIIFQCSLEEAQGLMTNDPFVLAGEMIVEFYPLYGSAALTKVPEIHKAIERKVFEDIQKD